MSVRSSRKVVKKRLTQEVVHSNQEACLDTKRVEDDDGSAPLEKPELHVNHQAANQPELIACWLSLDEDIFLWPFYRSERMVLDDGWSASRGRWSKLGRDGVIE
jgi:hypothetical protein